MSELVKAIVAAQLEIVPPIKDKINPRFKSGYSSLDSIYNSVVKVLAKHGVWLTHSVEQIDGKPVLVTTLKHVSGEEVFNKIPMFIENQTSQGFASALTYSCRYATCRLLSLPSDEDDDGEAAEIPLMNASQISKIMELIGEDKSRLERMLKSYGKETLKEVPASNFDFIMNVLSKKKE